MTNTVFSPDILTTLTPLMLTISSPVCIRGSRSAGPSLTIYPTQICVPSSVPPTILNPKVPLA